MKLRIFLSLIALCLVVACEPQYRPDVSTELEMSQRDKLNLSLGLTGTFMQSCARDVKRFAPNRTALFHYLSHAEEEALQDPGLRVIVFDVPDRYDRDIKIVASHDDLMVLYSKFAGKPITDLYGPLSAPYDEETVEEGKRYEDIFFNALRLMDRVPLSCALPVVDAAESP